MTSVYELKQQQQELLDELYWVEEGQEESAIIYEKISKIDGDINRKLSYLSDVLAESIALSQLATEARKISAERLERKEKQAKRAEEKLREFILSVMKDFGIKSVKGDILNISRYERDAVIQLQNFDIDKLPSNLVKVTKVIDKTAINEEFKHGSGVEGFELVKKDCLRIS
jgi:hypothetical protein